MRCTPPCGIPASLEAGTQVRLTAEEVMRLELGGGDVLPSYLATRGQKRDLVGTGLVSGRASSDAPAQLEQGRDPLGRSRSSRLLV